MRLLELALALALVSACAPSANPPPARLPAIPAPPPLWPPDPRVLAPEVAPSAAATAEPAPLPVAPPAARPPVLPEADPGPIPMVTLEQPYKLGERPEPRSSQAYRDEIRELRHWGAGGVGELLAPLPGPVGHPDPRVVINLEKSKGPHDAAEVLRLARRNHWIQVVRCYRLGAYKDTELRGWTKAFIGISRAGEVVRPKLLQTELGDRAVADCIVDKLRALKLPPARANSQAWLELRVGPGDEPMPPPEELLVPGDGSLAVEAMGEGVRAGLARFEECYRAAFGYAPGLWGRMLLRFHVTERGKVDEAFEAGTQFPDARVSQCVVHAARGLTFARPQGGDVRFVVGVRFRSDRSHHELPPVMPTGQKRNGQE
jgi:hypothetical protein